MFDKDNKRGLWLQGPSVEDGSYLGFSSPTWARSAASIMHSRDIAGDIFESLICGFVVLLPFFDLLNLLEKYWKDVSLQHV